ncbi:NAD(P)H-binding protein [Pyxidicoccus sp. MSG2]|uniref:NmrA family NAD(P)-binding protein n=1 Tax=Pyxidicoccus sp. MSG2 TaxID=2996790 RepID=UPI00226DE403|nr:NAD(P)H-binding protein [Pyxidicoccus sp. MSG2]MCY1017728.1 NAD(P)H-binding protein [Pyxidicoccus sp. MSG2]
MRALVLGGTGQTGTLVARGLGERGVAVRTASRSAQAGDHAVFDWERGETHEAALRDVEAVFLVAPATAGDPAQVMVPFIERAVSMGVRSFVLLSSSAIEEGTPGMGAVHAALRARAPGWTVLRPSWFMQNFFQPRHHLAQGLARNGQMLTATGQGRVGLIDVADIAAVAVETLLAPVNQAPVLTGPEALSYDEVAAILSEVTGRRLEHRAVSVDEARASMMSAGIPEAYASLLAGMEASIARGSEDRTTDSVLRITGRRPRSFREVASRITKTRDAGLAQSGHQGE